MHTIRIVSCSPSGWREATAHSFDRSARPVPPWQRATLVFAEWTRKQGTSSQLDPVTPGGPGILTRMNRIAVQRQLGRKITVLRKSRGLTQEALARMCGMAAGRMWKLENGRVNPTLATLVRIARQLRTRPAELLSVAVESGAVTGAVRREVQAALALRIKAVRRAKGWSQDALAQRCGISPGLLGEIERGHKNFQLLTLLLIARALETTVADLLAGIV